MSTKQALIEALQRENTLQKQLIESQQEVIRLYQQLEQLRPKKPELDARWYQVSGDNSTDVVKSGNLEQLTNLTEWLYQFGNKYVKPYVHSEVYSEIMTHMTRGLPAQMAKLAVMQDLGISPEAFITQLDSHSNRK
ncbi:MAG: hypothetical protein MUF87_07215 [Anaerolineae bacterium]|jgi:hypothetical protein|nr:hypothetical protein [Anaerolineae bacterium]